MGGAIRQVNGNAPLAGLIRPEGVQGCGVVAGVARVNRGAPRAGASVLRGLLSLHTSSSGRFVRVRVCWGLRGGGNVVIDDRATVDVK